MTQIQMIKKRRPKQRGFKQWEVQELNTVQSASFLKRYYGGTVEEAKVLCKKEFPDRSYEAVRQKIIYLDKKNGY